MNAPADPNLVERAQSGNLDALAELYEQHYGLIFRYLRARLGDHQAVEDLTSEVFKRMLGALPHYRPQGLPFRAWLFRIARNLLIDYYRRAGHEPLADWEDGGQPVDLGSDPAASIERSLTLERAFRALAELETNQREVVTLRFLSGLSIRETALAMDKSEDAVKALQRRGLAALRLSLAVEPD